MKKLVKLFCISMILTCFFSVINVEAAYNRSVTKTGSIKVDLNKDGKPETVKLQKNNNYSVNGSYKLQIVSNGKTVMSTYVDGVSLNDINSTDRYIDIITWLDWTGSDKAPNMKIYRYDGKKMNLYASAGFTYNIGSMTKVLQKNYCYWDNRVLEGGRIIRTNGKGVIFWECDYDISAVEDFYGKVKTYYKVTSGAIRYKSDMYAVDTGKEYCYPCRPWIAYQYPRVNINKKVFIVRRGEKIKILKLKITSNYVYAQVKRANVSGTGWVIFQPDKYGSI